MGSASDEADAAEPVAGQAAVGSLGGASTEKTCPVAILGAVANVGTNDTQLFEPLPAGTGASKRLAFQPRQAGWTAPRMSRPSSCSAKQYDDIVAALNSTEVGLEHPAATRLAFHTCGTYTALDASGGCDGAWIRFPPDADAHANGGKVKEAVEKLELVKARFPCITHADLYTLAGSVAVELAGGPPVAWSPGRIDADGPGPTHPAFSSRLPDGAFNGAGLAYFMTQWGFTPRETVAILGGGHSFGGANLDGSGWAMTFTAAGDVWPEPKNLYFKQLMGAAWVEATTNETGLPYFKLAPGEPGADARVEGKPVGRLPSDMALRVTRAYAGIAAEYAENESRFLADFSGAYEKLLALGSPGVGRQGGSWRWKGYAKKWEGLGADAAYAQLPAAA